MSKSVNRIKKQLSLCNDLIDIFRDYAYSLDEYFKDEKNREEHLLLWGEYQILNGRLRNTIKKYGFDIK